MVLQIELTHQANNHLVENLRSDIYNNLQICSLVKSAWETFRLKKKKRRLSIVVLALLNLSNSESRSKSFKQLHHSTSLNPFGGKLGLGHNFQLISLTNPSWCDHCGDFIWGLNKQCKLAHMCV